MAFAGIRLCHSFRGSARISSLHRIQRLSFAGTVEPTPSPPQSPVTDLSLLEVRIGKIMSIKKHPEAENLYIEEVDVGE